jgi:hypothetical protein
MKSEVLWIFFREYQEEMRYGSKCRSKSGFVHPQAMFEVYNFRLEDEQGEWQD